MLGQYAPRTIDYALACMEEALSDRELEFLRDASERKLREKMPDCIVCAFEAMVVTQRLCNVIVGEELGRADPTLAMEFLVRLLRLRLRRQCPWRYGEQDSNFRLPKAPPLSSGPYCNPYHVEWNPQNGSE